MFEAKINEQGFAVVLRVTEDMLPRLDEALTQGLGAGLAHAAQLAQQNYLSGPRPRRLAEVSTRLRQSMVWNVSLQEGRGIVGRMGTNVVYASFHEFGFKGTQNVKAHTRVVSQTTNAGHAFDNRRPIKDKQGRIVGYKESRLKAAGRQERGAVGFQRVKAHTRKINYAGKPFARPALLDAMPVIIQRLTAAVEGLKNA